MHSLARQPQQLMASFSLSTHKRSVAAFQTLYYRSLVLSHILPALHRYTQRLANPPVSSSYSKHSQRYHFTPQHALAETSTATFSSPSRWLDSPRAEMSAPTTSAFGDTNRLTRRLPASFCGRMMRAPDHGSLFLTQRWYSRGFHMQQLFQHWLSGQ